MEDTSSEKYIQKLENQKGGKITYKCLALFYADTNKVVRDHGVFLYQVGKTMYYEDFMFKRQLLGIELNKKENEEYVKFESSFDIDDIEKMEIVSKKDALEYCSKGIRNISKAGFFTKTFGSTVLMINLKNGFTIFLDLISKDFIEHIKKENK